MNQKTIRVFTSAAFNYLPKLRLLWKSLRKYHPEFAIYWAISDTIPEWANFRNEDIDGVIKLEDLGIENWHSWAFGLNRIELSTAIKPFAARYLLDKPNTKAVLYFDPDIVLFSRLDDMIQEFAQSSILLTPHQTKPETTIEAIIDNEICSLGYGIYNLGYLGVANDAEARTFLRWWGDRLLHFCHADLDRHLFTDQKWVNLVPAFFDRVGILKSPRFNVATWNITTRKMKEVSPWKFTVDGLPLGFYHFSGFDSGAHKIMANKYAGHNRAVIKLVNWYEKQLTLRKNKLFDSQPWGFDHFDDQTVITEQHRKIYRDRLDLQKAYPQPFSALAADGGINASSYAEWFKRQAKKEYPHLLGEKREDKGLLKNVLESNKSFWERLVNNNGDILYWIDNVTITEKDFSGWGWAVSLAAPIINIRILIKKGFLRRVSAMADGICTLNSPRPDVKAAYPNLKIGDRSGFYFRAPLPNGFYPRLFGFELTLSNGRVIRIKSNLTAKLNNPKPLATNKTSENDQPKETFDELMALGKRQVLIFDHQMGGGANFYRERKVKEYLRAGDAVAIVAYGLWNKKYNIQTRFRNKRLYNVLGTLREVEKFFQKTTFTEIFINDLASFKSPLENIGTIRSLMRRGIKLTIATHDFFAVCPSWTLIDHTGSFCGVPDLKKCAVCMKNNRELFASLVDERDVPEWRSVWGSLLGDSSEIICFSRSSKQILLRAYPKLEISKIKVRPHRVDYIRHKPVTLRSGPPRIGIVGEISKPKGSVIVAEMVELIKARKLKTKLTIVGTIDKTLDRKIVKITGRYEHANLPKLIQNSGAQVFLLPSIWPETFSFVAEELMRLNVPLAVFDLGAPAERVRKYKKGIIIPRVDAVAALDALEQFFTSTRRRFMTKKLEKLPAMTVPQAKPHAAAKMM